MRKNEKGGGYALLPTVLLALTMAVGPLGPVAVLAEDPQAQPGERVRVSTVTPGVGSTHEDELVGVLQSVDADGLTVLADTKPESVYVPASAIRRLELSRGRHRPEWAMPALVGGGALVGAMTGAIAAGGFSQCGIDYCPSDQEITHSVWTGAAVGAAVGAVGGLIGALCIHKELWAPASLSFWAPKPKLTLGLAPVRGGASLRVTLAY